MIEFGAKIFKKGSNLFVKVPNWQLCLLQCIHRNQLFP